MTSVVRELEWPASRAISSTGTPEADSRLTKLVRSSRGAHPSPMPAALQTEREDRRTFAASSSGADCGGEDQAVIPPELPGSQPLLVLPHAMLAQRLDDRLGQSQGPA